MIWGKTGNIMPSLVWGVEKVSCVVSRSWLKVVAWGSSRWIWYTESCLINRLPLHIDMDVLSWVSIIDWKHALIEQSRWFLMACEHAPWYHQLVAFRLSHKTDQRWLYSSLSMVTQMVHTGLAQESIVRWVHQGHLASDWWYGWSSSVPFRVNMPIADSFIGFVWRVGVRNVSHQISGLLSVGPPENDPNT